MQTREIQVRCEWNLHDVCTTSTPFINKKWVGQWIVGCGGGELGEIYKKPWKNAVRLTTLTSPKNNLENAMEVWFIYYNP